MVFGHHHEHNHDHDHDHDHGHGTARDLALEVLGEEPLDAGSRSLSEALKASFRVLKGIMVVLLVLYLFSNVRCILAHEQALVLRLGKLQPTVHDAGLVWALPFPIDSIITIPARASNEVLVKAHTFQRRREEEGRALSFIHRGIQEGLHPIYDGALLTSDMGLVHAQWKITYKVASVIDYITHLHVNLTGARISTEAAEELLTTLTANIGNQVAAELSAEELIRTRVDEVQGMMKSRLNQRLAGLNSGLEVTLVEMVEPTPPVQIRGDFENTQKAESRKQEWIRLARQEEVRILSEAVGEGYDEFRDLIERLEARDAAPAARVEAQEKLDDLLMQRAQGKAGKAIKDAGSYYATTVGRMRADVEEYRSLLPEFHRGSALLVERLWQHAWQEISENIEVRRLFKPSGLMQFRIRIESDPEHEREEQIRRMQAEEEAHGQSILPTPLIPVGPEFD